MLKRHAFFKAIDKEGNFSSCKTSIVRHALPILHVPHHIHDDSSCGRGIQHIEFMGFIQVVEVAVIGITVNEQRMIDIAGGIHVVGRGELPATLVQKEGMVSEMVVGVADADIEGNPPNS